MEIKKADSKGRVSGFEPGCYYHVEGTSRSRVLSLLGNDRLGIALGGHEKINESAQDYLRQFGIDPHTVPRDAANQEGYGVYIYEPDGKPTYKWGQRVIEPRPWPEGFDWDEFGRLVLGEVE